MQFKCRQPNGPKDRWAGETDSGKLASSSSLERYNNNNDSSNNDNNNNK